MLDDVKEWKLISNILSELEDLLAHTISNDSEMWENKAVVR
jgi:hypothetical protein